MITISSMIVTTSPMVNADPINHGRHKTHNESAEPSPCLIVKSANYSALSLVHNAMRCVNMPPMHQDRKHFYFDARCDTHVVLCHIVN